MSGECDKCSDYCYLEGSSCDQQQKDKIGNWKRLSEEEPTAHGTYEITDCPEWCEAQKEIPDILRSTSGKPAIPLSIKCRYDWNGFMVAGEHIKPLYWREIKE